jgi:hypothetical protein
MSAAGKKCQQIVWSSALTRPGQLEGWNPNRCRHFNPETLQIREHFCAKMKSRFSRSFPQFDVRRSMFNVPTVSLQPSAFSIF